MVTKFDCELSLSETEGNTDFRLSSTPLVTLTLDKSFVLPALSDPRKVDFPESFSVRERDGNSSTPKGTVYDWSGPEPL